MAQKSVNNKQIQNLSDILAHRRAWHLNARLKGPALSISHS